MTKPDSAELSVALVVGLLFGLGLLHSGMTDPSKVLGFLDLFGRWDPSLALVMASAVAVGLVGFRLYEARTRSVLGFPMRLPANRKIDRRLMVGAVVFGVGWGLAGLCPGPALVVLASGSREAMVFAAAMLAGMLAFEVREGHDDPRSD